VADTDTNALLILTVPANFERLQTIIADLDRPIPQVVIKVLIAEVTWSDELDVGFEFSILDTQSDGDEFSLSTDFGAAAAEGGGLVYKIVCGDLTALLRALEKIGKLDVLSRPHILASDNQPATITVGEEVPFVTNTRTTETGQTINTIQYEDIGIILEVTPHINPDGLVIMDVYPEISTTTADTVPISETLAAAVFAKRSAQTRIAIRDGQTIVIGGLMQDRKTQTLRRVPVLGSIPVIGALFRRTTDDTEKTELLIFLTPHVAREASELEGISQQEMSGARQMDEAVGPGVFERHLEGLRLGGDTAAPSSY
jgi:general secretion pathway protein D